MQGRLFTGFDLRLVTAGMDVFGQASPSIRWLDASKIL
jgi:hypothetical protein